MKLIITGVKEGKITYVEGEEVVTSVADIQAQVEELRVKISKAKAANRDLVEETHKANLAAIAEDFNRKVVELEAMRNKAIDEEYNRYNSEVSGVIDPSEVEVLEREEAKLSLILGGLKAQQVDNEPQPEEVEAQAEEVVEEVETKVEEVKEVLRPVVQDQETLTARAELPKPRRIIF